MSSFVNEFIANRNVQIYDLYCWGHRYRTLSLYYDLTESSIKRILKQERKLRGIKKEKGKRC